MQDGASLTVSSEEGNGCTLRASPTCPTNAMDVVFRIVGIVIIENMRDVFDILQGLALTTTRKANDPGKCCVKQRHVSTRLSARLSATRWVSLSILVLDIASVHGS